MVIRDRLLALIYRIFGFGFGMTTLWLNISANATDGFWSGFSSYSTIITLFGTIVFFTEIITNLIGIKKARNTLAPGIFPFIFHATLALEVSLAATHPFYCHFVSAAYFDLIKLPYVLLTYMFFPLVMLLDWILFGEKGTVRWSYGMFPLFIPVFYYLFSLMEYLVMGSTSFSIKTFDPETFLVATNLPETFKGGNGWAGVFLSCVILLGLNVVVDFLIIFINDLFVGKYFRKKGY